jgi:hypothetical protein
MYNFSVHINLENSLFELDLEYISSIPIDWTLSSMYGKKVGLALAGLTFEE